MCNRRLVIVPMVVLSDNHLWTQRHGLVHCQSLELIFFSWSAVLWFNLHVKQTNLENYFIGDHIYYDCRESLINCTGWNSFLLNIHPHIFYQYYNWPFEFKKIWWISSDGGQNTMYLLPEYITLRFSTKNMAVSCR